MWLRRALIEAAHTGSARSTKDVAAARYRGVMV
jgi:hypothetical protein